MTDRPILFSGPMVRALLAGTKTQTRRLAGVPVIERGERGLWHIYNRSGGSFAQCEGDVGKIAADFLPIEPGDRLWVREAWRVSKALNGIAPRDLDRTRMPEWLASDPDLYEGRIRASMHLPRWASRITLIVTNVRVQRLQDISEEDARAEGAYVAPRSGRVADDYVTMAIAGSWFASGRGWYADLWDRINGTGSWAANPWIAAYSFTVHQQNINTLTAGDGQ